MTRSSILMTASASRAKPRRLKVLHVISGDLWAGAEVQVCTLLRTLRAETRDVEVIAALMNDGELASRLRQCGIAVSVLDENRLNALSIFLGLRQLMRECRPDVVHTHRTKENILGALANATTFNVPCLRTVHGASERVSGGLRGLLETSITRLDLWCGRTIQQRVLAVSADLAQKLARHFPSENVVVIENGVDAAALRAALHPVEFRQKDPDRVHVGIVGRLVPVKRVDLFLETAVLLRRLHPTIQWSFHVFGDGPLRRVLEERGREDLGCGITFHGHRSDVVACMAALDVLMLCSDHEGMPMAALESLAVGTRIVAHAVGGLVDVLRHSESGVLVDSHAAAGYAQAVRRLLESTSGQTALPARFTAAFNAARTYELYRELVSRGRARARLKPPDGC